VPSLSADLVLVFQQASLVTPGTDTFTSSQAKRPQGAGPFTYVIETAGAGVDYTHTQAPPWREWLSAQVSARAATFDAAAVQARALFDVVKQGLVNRTINGTYYLSIRPRQSPFDMGQDEGFAKVGFNVMGQARG
jgi:hypothetical protein